MKLGISSLSHIVSVGRKLQENNMHVLLMQATRTCLEFSENHQLDVCELLIDPVSTFDLEKKRDFINVCNEFSLPKQVHAALTDVSLCSNNQEISDATLKTYKNNVDIAKDINAKTITIHPGISSIPISIFKENNQLRLVHQLKDLLAYSKDACVKICLENMDPNAGLCRNEEEMLTLHQNVRNPELKFTYDTSHLWMNSSKFSTFIEVLHPYIGNVHIADNLDKKQDQHPLIGTGNVPFPKIIEILRMHNYSDSLIIEILDASGLEKSIDYMKKIL